MHPADRGVAQTRFQLASEEAAEKRMKLARLTYFTHSVDEAKSVSVI